MAAAHKSDSGSRTVYPLRVKIAFWLPVLVWLFFFAFYAVNRAPSIVTFFDDTLEFQYVLPTFGIAHPTGYPLYTILGGLFTRLLPLGEWAGRANLFSAATAAGAVALVAAVAYQLLSLKQGIALRDEPVRDESAWQQWTQAPILAALFAATVFGMGRVWWTQATVAEVYPLHNLLVALALLLALLAGRTGAKTQHSLLVALFATLGLGLAHHRTTALLLPGIALYLLWSNPWLAKPQRTWFAYALALLAPLALYLWLPLRAAMGVQDLNGAYQNTLAGFWRHVMASQYTAFFSATSVSVERTTGEWFALAVRELGWFAFLLAVWGFFIGAMGRATVGRASRSASQKAWVMVLLVGLANLLFALFYRVGDVEVFLLPVWMCVALAAGGGADWVVRSIARRSGVALVLWVAFFLLFLWSVESRQAILDRSDDWRAHDLALAMTASDFPANSVVIGLEGEITALRYMQAALGRAHPAQLRVADDETLRRTLLEDAIARGDAVYLTREIAGIEQAYSFGGAGALVRVWPRGQSESPAPRTRLDQPMADGALTLLGYDLAPLAVAGVPTADLALYWLPTQPLTQTFKLSLRVVAATGEVLPLRESFFDGVETQVEDLAQQDLYPLRLVAPTTAWLPEEVVRDAYQIPLPAGLALRARDTDAAIEDATLLVIVYDAATLAEAGRFTIPLAPGY